MDWLFFKELPPQPSCSHLKSLLGDAIYWYCIKLLEQECLCGTDDSYRLLLECLQLTDACPILLPQQTKRILAKCMQFPQFRDRREEFIFGLYIIIYFAEQIIDRAIIIA